MSGVQHLTVREEDGEPRLDRWFKRYFPDLSHGRLEKLLRTGQIRVDGGRAKASQKLATGQVIRVPPLPPPTAPDAEADPYAAPWKAPEAPDWLLRAILHRDDHLIVINKPADLAVQGGTGLTRHLDAYLDGLRFGATDRPRLVHRLDRDTSGVLVLARTPAAAAFLAKAFKSRDAEKTYWAVVVGVPDPREGLIKAPLGKQGGEGRERVGLDEDDGKPAVTAFRVLENAAPRAALLELQPRTGRTHQLRVHCQILGTPILGDGKYAGRDAFLAGAELPRKLHLHARRLRLPHPAGGHLTVAAPPPPHMLETFRFFGFDPD